MDPVRSPRTRKELSMKPKDRYISRPEPKVDTYIYLYRYGTLVILNNSYYLSHSAFGVTSFRGWLFELQWPGFDTTNGMEQLECLCL